VSILVIDVGSSSVRASVVSDDGSVGTITSEPIVASSPMPSFVEYDASSIADAVMRVATTTLEASPDVDGIGIANQRATTLLWDRATGQPVGPAISWQDLRTVVTCLILHDQGVLLAPNESATKLGFLLDLADPDRERDLCFGTVDSWVIWTLSGGTIHVTDVTNSGVTGMRKLDGTAWDETVTGALNIPARVLPEVVDSSGVIGNATALPGAPPICGILGDQQASLVGQGCTLPGLTKITFGTGGFLDSCLGSDRPSFGRHGDSGTFPIAAWQRHGQLTWGIEAIILSAGSCIDWLREDLGIIDSAAESDTLAASVKDSEDLWFVPALFGLGTPVWDFGARGAFIGITRGTGRPEIVRSVLDGIAHRGCDLIDAAEIDTGTVIPQIRLDGGMSDNKTFVAALADYCGRPVEVAPMTECTTLGAAYMAGLALGTWSDEAEIASLWRPKETVDPRIGPDERATLRQRWASARLRAQQTIPELSTLDFWDQ
jgi:glycerol kinase